MANQLRPAEQHMDLCCMLCASLDGREVWGRTDTCICMAESLHCSPEHITTLLIGYTPMQNVFGVKKLKFGGKKRSPAAKTFGTICPRFSCNYFNVGVTHTHTHTHTSALSIQSDSLGGWGDWKWVAQLTARCQDSVAEQKSVIEHTGPL